LFLFTRTIDAVHPMPRLTIVMPTHTERGFLAASMESAIRSLQPDDELLIVANGAAPAYVAALETIVRTPARLIVLAEAGVAHARNAGLREASGAFVLFLDDDDLLIDGGADILRRELEAHPSWSGVAGEIIRFDGANEQPCDEYAAAGTLITPLRLLGQSITTPGAVVLRTDVVRRLGGFHQDRAPTEDFDLWLRVAADAPLVGLSAPVLRYRVHAASASSNVLRMSAQALTTFHRHAGAYSAWSFSLAMRRAATQMAGYYRPKLQGQLRERARSGQWASVPIILVLIARFRWLSLRSRIRSRLWRMVNRRTDTANPSEPPLHYLDQSTSTLEVAE
jgi:glycosyltransferase involved in cell wall biosynthesis